MAVQLGRRISAQEFVFREGDAADCAYIVEQGRLQVTLQKDGIEMSIASLGPGDIFGEMGIIDGSCRSASVQALEDCVLTVISRQLLSDRLESADPIVRLLVSILLKRVRNSGQNLKGMPESQLETDETWIQQGIETFKLESDLMEALENKEFLMHYQPIYSLETEALQGYEALLRWQSPERGMVRPDLFINVAEQTSVIVPLGYWILEQSIKDQIRIHELSKQKNLFMSINVSVRQLLDPRFVSHLQTIINKLGANPKSIKLEVTERVFQESPLILQAIKRLRWAGFRISLDDFGTGYSSLTSLFNLPVDDIKVDRSFVTNVTTDQKSRAIVQAVIALGLELNLTVVAEGIEKPEQILFLRQLGCKLGQGFHYSRPMPLDKVLEGFSKSNKKVV